MLLPLLLTEKLRSHWSSNVKNALPLTPMLWIVWYNSLEIAPRRKTTSWMSFPLELINNGFRNIGIPRTNSKKVGKEMSCHPFYELATVLLHVSALNTSGEMTQDILYTMIPTFWIQWIQWMSLICDTAQKLSSYYHNISTQHPQVQKGKANSQWCQIYADRV